MTGEVWVPCAGGVYSVSNLGRVRRDASACGAVPGRILKQRTTRLDRYPHVSLSVDGVVRRARVAHLVAAAFLGPRPLGNEVNHKNGDKGDSRAGNLEWATRNDNQRHAYRMGLRHPTHIRLKESDVRRIRELWSAGRTQRSIGSEYQMHQASVSAIVTKRTWARLP